MNSAAKIETQVIEIPTNSGILPPVEMFWFDMESTGLDEEIDSMLEVGIILTDKWGNEIFEEEWQFQFDLSKVSREPQIDPFVLEMHEKSGLWDICKIAQPVSEGNVGRQIVKILQDHGVEPKKMELAGSTPHFDRGFIKNFMPDLHHFLHYRHIDVSGFRSVAEKLNPSIMELGPTKRDIHRALPDLEDSIALYQFLVENFFFVVDGDVEAV